MTNEQWQLIRAVDNTIAYETGRHYPIDLVALDVVSLRGLLEALRAMVERRRDDVRDARKMIPFRTED